MLTKMKVCPEHELEVQANTDETKRNMETGYEVGLMSH